jgi:preflagellin peptidase FlaK
MLAVSAFIDIKKREIPDKIWLGFGTLGIVLILGELGLLGDSFQNMLNPINNATATPTSSLLSQGLGYIVGTAIITVIAYAIYKTGLFGGADSKALIVIAILVPSWYSNSGMLFKLPGAIAFTVLTNAVLISLWQLAYNSVRNLSSIAKGISIFEGMEETGTRKALAFVMGYRSKSAKGYLFPMESVDESGKKRFRFNPFHYDEFVDETDTISSEKSSNSNIWVTQAMPFLVYIGIGFGITLTLGDLLGVIIRSVINLLW